MTQEQELRNYIDAKMSYNPQMNVLLNDRTKDWYVDIGKYFIKVFPSSPTPYINPYYKTIDGRSSKSRKTTAYSGISILFLTAILGPKELKSMFGDPIYHNEFGEGFEITDYNKEDMPPIECEYASHFVTINGIKCHIGYDHRGTCVEVDSKITSPVAISDVIKSLIDKYKESC